MRIRPVSSTTYERIRQTRHEKSISVLLVVVAVALVIAFGATSPILQAAPQAHIVTGESYCELPRSGPACVLVLKSDSGRNVSITSVAIDGISMNSVIVDASFCKSPVPKEALPITIPAGKSLRIGVTAASTPPDRVVTISVVFDDSKTIASEFVGTPNDLFCNFNG